MEDIQSAEVPPVLTWYTQMSGFEMFLMIIITGISNFASLPVLVYFKHKAMHLHFFIGYFTMITSFIYHFLESLRAENFFYNLGHWHRLGSIACFISFLNFLTDYELNDEYTMNFLGLFLAILFQEADPWEIQNTIIPILIILSINISVLIRRKRWPNLHYDKLKKALLFLLIMFFFFYKGLDETQDYLRLYHGGWHIAVSFFGMRIWQVKSDKQLSYFEMLQLEGRQKRLILN